MRSNHTFVALIVFCCIMVSGAWFLISQSKVRYLNELEPPAQYNRPYNGQVVERIMPVAEVHALCKSKGASARGVACSWLSSGTCYIVLPNDEQAPVSTYRRHEIAHCNGWPANHPRNDG